MDSVGAKQGSARGGLRGCVFGALTLVLLPVAIYTVNFLTTGVWPDVCRTAAETRGLAILGCAEQYTPVNSVEAEKFLAEHLRNAAGNALMQEAWPQLARDLQESLGADAFQAAWTDYVFAELDGPVVATSRLNEFKYSYRRYAKHGQVVTRESTIQLVMEEGDIRVKAYRGGLNVSSDRLRGEYAKLTVRDKGDGTLWYPRLDSQPQMLADDFSVGGHFEALCQLEVEGMWWVRTPYGWMPDIGFDSPSPFPDVIDCADDGTLRVGLGAESLGES
jgi:hypothetical protein